MGFGGLRGFLALDGGGGGAPDFSYIWIANSAQNTISKIDTQTLVELGRYLVRPDGLGNPSRTSVNLSGDVVTASRSGGFTKFHARLEDCVESNGIPGIQTATDANFLPWDQEECRAWHTPMAYESQRPAAWTQGTFNPGTCKYSDQKVWTSGNNIPEDGAVDVLLVNGDTGAIEATIPVTGINPDYYGIYGAAVDKNGNFWGSQLSQGWLIFIDLQTKQVKQWPMATSGYGMTVDSKGYVWTCSSNAARFDPMTETWQVVAAGGSGGCMEDGAGTLYMSGGGGNIVATPGDLSCEAACSTKTAQLNPGTVISLNVDMLATGPGWNSTFDGWSGGCTGSTTCYITLAQASTVTARFTCHGWCPESLPNETTNLNAIFGFTAQSIVAVGDAGKILRWDGNSWKVVNSMTPNNLRSVHGVASGTGYAVGAMGTILQTTNQGASWSAMTSGTTVDLRGVWTLDGAEAYACGDNIMAGKPWLALGGTTWTPISRSNADYKFNAIWGWDSINYFLVGEGGHGIRSNPYAYPTPLSATEFFGVFGTAEANITMVGLGKTIQRWNPGTVSWTAMAPPAGAGFVPLRAIHGSSASSMFTVGGNGTVWFYNGSEWLTESFPTTTDLKGVYVISPAEVYVVGDGGVIYHKKP